MTGRVMKSRLQSLLIATVAGLAGCASVGSSNTMNLLSAAGFRQSASEAAEHKDLYGKLPAYEVQRIESSGKALYAYKDEKNRIVYLGDSANHERFRQLALQQQQEYQAEQQRQRDRVSGSKFQRPS